MAGRGELATREQLFGEIYVEFAAAVYAYCRRRFPPEVAEDVAAEVFTTVWRRIDQVPLSSNERLPWLYRVAYLTASNQRRRFARRIDLDARLKAFGAAKPSEPSPDHRVTVREEVRAVLKTLDGLRAADQEILRLSVWEQLSPVEIAAVLEISPDAASQRLHRARRRLTTAFDDGKEESS